MYICLAGQQLAEEKERREHNQRKKVAQAAHKRKHAPSQGRSADGDVRRQQIDQPSDEEVIPPSRATKYLETNAPAVRHGGDDEYEMGEEDDEEEAEDNEPMSIREAALQSEFTVPRESERKLPTQRHVKPHPIAASSPISSSQRKVIAVSAETATRSSPGPQGGFCEPSSITHPTQPHGNRHCIAVSAPIPSELAGKLLGDDGYIFEDAATSMGMYEHPILQDVINAQWFMFGASFNPIPDPVIVLVFTAVEYAITQWASGLLVSGSQFSEADYHDVYKRHLNGLEQWRNFST
ncbi:hypothetical protein JB92DRAFT_3122804 [Gautieria morchelliformis]|nr:hypothetical protein JB92DRAFT_3122804 [Gautieria morchelliformis]